MTNGYCNVEIYLNSITSPCVQRVSTNDLIKENAFFIANNPVNNELIVNHLGLNAAVVFSIYDLKGIKLINQKTNNSDKTRIDISGLKSGFYVIECLTSTGKAVLKFVKQ